MDSETGSLKARVEALAAEASEHRERLEASKQALAEERDERIRALRAEYVERTAAIEDELATLRRLENALASPAPKLSRKRKTPVYRPRGEALRLTLQAINDGADIVSAIAQRSSVNRATTANAIDALRNDGLIRLSGERAAHPSFTKARTYAITDAGVAFLLANETAGNGSSA